jgi:hypothetical protein
VAKDFEIGDFQSLEEMRIDVRDEDPARIADAVTEPPRDRSTSASHFQAVPAGRQAAIL